MWRSLFRVYGLECRV